MQHANSLSKRAEKEDNLAKSASLACVGILKELNNRLHSSVHAQLVAQVEGVEHTFQKIILTRNYIEANMFGDPVEDRKAIVDAIREGAKASSITDLEVLADNLEFLRVVMVEHHALCLRVPVECEAPLTDIELGRAYFKRIDWEVGLLNPLNSWLFGHYNQGFMLMVAVMKEWVRTHPSVPKAIEMVSSNYAAPAPSLFASAASSHKTSQSDRPCFSWNGHSCDYERSSGNKCNFTHTRGKDTRQERSRSRSRDRSEFRRRDDGDSNRFRRDRSSSRESGGGQDVWADRVWADRYSSAGGGGRGIQGQEIMRNRDIYRQSGGDRQRHEEVHDRDSQPRDEVGKYRGGSGRGRD